MTVRQAALAACRVTSKGEKHMEKKYVLEFKDIRKSFSGVQVLNDISFSVERERSTRFWEKTEPEIYPDENSFRSLYKRRRHDLI